MDKASSPSVGLLVSAVLIGIAGCSNIVDPPLDARVVRLPVPAVYPRWWAMVETCSGKSSSLPAVSWFHSPGSSTVDRDGTAVAGYWAPNSNSIVLAGESVMDGSIVRHEMLHAILRKSSGHSRKDFLERCLGVVSCGPDCRRDAGDHPAVDPDVIRASSEAFDVSAYVIPAEPSSDLEGGVFTVVVSARNVSSAPVLFIPTGPSVAFSVAVFGGDGGIGLSNQITDLSAVYFRAGETKRHFFDFSIGTGLPGKSVRPGLYTVTGAYGSRAFTLENVTIR